MEPDREMIEKAIACGGCGLVPNMIEGWPKDWAVDADGTSLCPECKDAAQSGEFSQ